MSRGRILYFGIMAAVMVSMLLVRAYAGDPNPDPLRIIGGLFPP
jgi:hypothetical protein